MPENPGGMLYGTILVATLLAAESPGHESYAKTVGAVAVAMVAYWLVSAYARYTGERATRGEHFELRGYGDALAHETAVLVGALGPLLAVLGCWAFGATLGSATWIAVLAAAAIVVATEVALGLRSHLDGRDLVAQTGFGIVVGVAVVALRVLLH